MFLILVYLVCFQLFNFVEVYFKVQNMVMWWIFNESLNSVLYSVEYSIEFCIEFMYSVVFLLQGSIKPSWLTVLLKSYISLVFSCLWERSEVSICNWNLVYFPFSSIGFFINLKKICVSLCNCYIFMNWCYHLYELFFIKIVFFIQKAIPSDFGVPNPFLF